MKKILALALCLVTILSCFVGCEFGEASKKVEDKGATIQIYMSSEVYNFDPLQAYIDDASQQVMSLLYEGLFTLNADGKRVKAACKSYRIVDNDREHYIEFTIRESYWSDGRQVSAADYVDAFQRALETEATHPAAAMLMGIKNAYDIKHATGDRPLSIDDLGVTDVGVNILKVEFDHTVDYELFMDYMASPLLVPLRRDIYTKADEWASNASILVANGPFFVRSVTPGDSLILERNPFYNRDPEEDSVKKAVTPWRLKINYDKTVDENLTDFINGDVLYMAELPIEARTSMADQIKEAKTGSMSQLSVFFNTKDDLLSNAKVRKALSMALSRKAIAELLVYATPATGIIGSGVYETTYKNKTLFSEVSGKLFAEDANKAGAQALLDEAGVTSGKITITYRDTPADEAVFQYIKSVWGDLGFTVKGDNKLDFTHRVDDNEYDMYYNDFYHAYAAGEFQVMLVDMLMNSTDPFSTLAPFAKQFSGNKIELQSVVGDETGEETEDTIIETPHVTGFDNETYNQLIADAFAITSDNAERAALLHQAENLLAEECPVAPLVEYRKFYVISKDLSGYKTTAYGLGNFNKVKMKSYDPDTEAPKKQPEA